MILIIDDEPQIRTLFQETLEHAGYDVRLACNGHEGLQRFCETPVDLVITDVFMPEQDGLEVIMMLHRESPTIPIIALTGNGAGPDFLNVAKRLGAHRTFAKPLSAKELIQTVQQLLHKAS